MIDKFEVKAAKTLDPFGEGEQHSTSKIIIHGQNRKFLNQVTYKYPNLVKSIKENLFVWISRVSYACLKESQKIKNVSEGGLTFLKTIEEDNHGRKLDSHRRYRSIELTREKREKSRGASKHRYF